MGEETAASDPREGVRARVRIIATNCYAEWDTRALYLGRLCLTCRENSFPALLHVREVHKDSGQSLPSARDILVHVVMKKIVVTEYKEMRRNSEFERRKGKEERGGESVPPFLEEKK